MASSMPPAGASAAAQAGGKVASGLTLPFRSRPVDMILVLFFLINIGFITYIVDIEQLTIPSYAQFLQTHQYPLWPPPPLVDMVHSYGTQFDPLLLARPPWWKATIWIDALGFGPFYAFAIYAFIKGKNWIRLPSIIWASVMMTNVTIILSEEFFGPHATPQPVIVTLANLPWLLFPILTIARMWRSEKPFAAPGTASGAAG